MFRKHRNPTPGFRMPPPFQPMTGTHAALQVPGVFPHCVLMQVAAEDTEDEYVLCRGFDPRINKFIDYEEGNEDKPGIPVAKPYRCRMAGLYHMAEIYAAALPVQSSCPSPTGAKIRIGQNPGKAKTSTGPPADLDEEVEELFTTEGKAVNWMFIDFPGEQVCFELAETLSKLSGSKALAYIRVWNPSAKSGDGDYVVDCCQEIYVADRKNVGYYGIAGAQGSCTLMWGENGPLGVIDDLCCSGDEQGECDDYGYCYPS